MKGRSDEGTKRRRENEVRRASWLCVAYAFPPISRSGTHRTLEFVRHLDRLGWDATVLTAQPQDEPVDPDLLRRIPASAAVIRTSWVPFTQRVKDCSRFLRFASRCRTRIAAPANRHKEAATEPTKSATNGTLRDWASRLLLTPDSRLGWVPSALRAAREAVSRCRPQVLYTTSPYMSAHLIGLLVALRQGLPWVADFRDPWRGNPFRDLGYPSLDRWDAMLERWVCRRARRIVCSTHALRDELSERLPWAVPKSVVIPNGYDAERIAAAPIRRTAGPGKYVVVHCGNFYGPRSPLPLFRALRRAADRSPDVARRFHLLLVGDETHDGQSLRTLSAQCGIEPHVEILGVRPHEETLGLMRGADASLLVGLTGAGGNLQVPNKLYEYLAVRKPILALAPQDGAIADVLATTHANALVCDPAGERQIAAAIEQIVQRAGVSVDNAWSGVARYDRRRSAKALAEVFCEISRAPSAREGGFPLPRPVIREEATCLC